MLRREDKFYINTLKDFLHGNRTEPVVDLDWNIVLDHAKKQNTNGIVYYQCKDFIPTEYSTSLNKMYLAELYAYGVRTSITKEITNKLETNNIDYFVVKGPIIAEYYPVPALRTMGDTDFIVHENDLERVCEIIEGLGYARESHVTETVFSKNNRLVEVHTCLARKSKSKDNDKEVEFCDRVWEYVTNRKLDNSYHFVFLILHLIKHLSNEGAGIRQFFDLAIMLEKTNVNLEFVDKELEKIGYLNFKRIAMSLIDRWFEVSIKSEEITDNFYEEATEKILKNGVHGFYNDSNQLNKVFKKLSDSKNEVSSKSKIKYLKDMFFPKYETLIKMGEYQFIKDKRYLIPLAWVLRIFISIKNNKAIKQFKKAYTELFVLRKEIKKKQKERNDWGL